MSLWLNSGLIVMLAGMSLALTSCSRVSAKTSPNTGEVVPVRAVLAVMLDVPLEIAAVGTVEAIDTVEVKSRVVGQVERVAFQEGESVAKGQLLFTIDRDVLDRQAARQRAELARDAAVEEQARAGVARDAASRRQSDSEAETALQLGKLGVISGQRVDQLVTSRDTANAGLHSDQAAVVAATASRKADEARLTATELQLSFTKVVAPITGRAGAAMIKAGNMSNTCLLRPVGLAHVASLDHGGACSPSDGSNRFGKAQLQLSCSQTRLVSLSGCGTGYNGCLVGVQSSIRCVTRRHKLVYPLARNHSQLS